MSKLFSPFSIGAVIFRNRIFVSPMCQYSSRDGLPTDWHLVHLGSRAVGGAGLVMVEATAVSPEGRISPEDSGLWSDAHAEAFAPIARFISEQGAVAGIQIGHAGRKGSCSAPWRGGAPLGMEAGGWQTLAPSAVPFAVGHPPPRALTLEELEQVEEQFRAAAGRALAAGFQVLEIHMAHGYLLHEFLSPLANRRQDDYGGCLENRLRFPLRVARAVRQAWPEDLPLFVRISATDWAAGGWDIDQSVLLARALKGIGVDLIDCSSGAVVRTSRFPPGRVSRSPLPPGSGPRPGWPAARSASSWNRHRRSRSWPPARPTSCCWRGRCCATPTGRSTLPGRCRWTSPGRASTCGPNSRRQKSETIAPHCPPLTTSGGYYLSPIPRL